MKSNGMLLEKAISIAVEAHHGQKDRYGKPYILHPLRVMSRVVTEKEKIVAILHDVVEDTSCSFAKLEDEGFPDEIIKAVDALTKREGEEYEQLVERAFNNALARSVKLADLEDNMDLRRVPELKEKDVERFNKYVRAHRKLTLGGQDQS